jgi:hypothetical protein
MSKTLRVIAIAGLVVGAALGMAGTLVSADNLRAELWAIDSTGLIVATAILALRAFRAGNDAAAAGFLVYCVGEAVMLGGTAQSLAGSVPAFAAGTALWSAGLLLVSVPRGFAVWARMTGVAAAILFGFVSLSIFWGAVLTPISRPFPYFAYPLLVLTFVGWMVGLGKEGPSF